MEVSKEPNVFDTRQISSQGYKKEELGKKLITFSVLCSKTEVIETTIDFHSST